MRILLLSEVFPPQTGGSGRWFWEIYRRFPRDEVFVAAGEYQGAEAFDRGHSLPIRRLPLSMPEWGLRNFAAFRRYWRLFGRVKQLVRAEKVDRIHAGRVLPEGWIAWLLKKWLGLPYVVYVHGEELSYGDNSRELRWMMERVFTGSEQVVVNSQNTSTLLQSNWRLSPKKITVLHPGVDTKRFVPSRNSSKSGRSRPVLLTVGRLQKRKGHDMLIRALPKIREIFPNICYQIIGDGRERSALEDLAKTLDLGRHVAFLGEPSDEDLVQYYQQCDLFALPNREVDGDFEGFGIVLLEAQSSGRPVLAGDSGGTIETMNPGETGVIVDCTSPEPLGKAVLDLLSDHVRRERMGKSARQWVVERFDWSALAAEAAEIFGLSSSAKREICNEELALHA